MQPKTKKFPRQRHFLAVFFIAFMWGVFGVDRMYLGKWGTGLLKLVTFGGFGLWALFDISLIMSGAMRDKQGREMLQVAEYKAFAAKVVLLFTVVVALVVLVNGAILIAAVVQFMNDFQNGGIPGLDALNGLNGLNGLGPEEKAELGL